MTSDGRHKPKSKHPSRILIYLATRSITGATVSETAAALNLGKATTWFYLNKMYKAGQVAKGPRRGVTGHPEVTWKLRI